MSQTNDLATTKQLNFPADKQYAEKLAQDVARSKVSLYPTNNAYNSGENSYEVHIFAYIPETATLEPAPESSVEVMSFDQFKLYYKGPIVVKSEYEGKDISCRNFKLGYKFEGEHTNDTKYSLYHLKFEYEVLTNTTPVEGIMVYGDKNPESKNPKDNNSDNLFIPYTERGTESSPIEDD